MTSLRNLSGGAIAAGVGQGDLDPVEIAQEYLHAIEAAPELNAVITLTAERALDHASGTRSGPLAGVPLLVKDLFDVEGVRTTYGSAIYASHVPAQTAAVVSQLEALGATVLGKANLHEFAWGTTSQNPHWGSVRNPLCPDRVAGGSSGGNAAALAAGLCTLGVGTDTAGSVRIPAACCGVVGFKPANGTLSLEGCFPLAPSFDTPGLLARSVRECASAYAALIRGSVPNASLEGRVVGLLTSAPGMSPHEPGREAAPNDEEVVRAYRDQLEDLGARVVDVRLPEPDADVVPIFLFEAARAHAETFPSRRDEYGPDLQHKLTVAREVPADVVPRAQESLLRWRARAGLDPQVDLVLSPTLGGVVPSQEVWEPDVRLEMVAYTRSFSFLGWPAIAIGNLHFAGRDADTVLAAALAWEAAYGVVPPPW